MIAVHVAQLLKAPVGTTRSYEFREDEPELAAELGLVGPVEGSVRVMRTTHGVLADVRYRVEHEQECARCLETARSFVESEFRQEFLPTTDIYTGLPDTIAADPDEPRIDENHVLDLTESIRQDILLQQPLRPLCQAECAGLCTMCGQNLNEGRCGHESTEEEQPIGRLGELLRQKLAQE